MCNSKKKMQNTAQPCMARGLNIILMNFLTIACFRSLIKSSSHSFSQVRLWCSLCDADFSELQWQTGEHSLSSGNSWLLITLIDFSTEHWVLEALEHVHIGRFIFWTFVFKHSWCLPCVVSAPVCDGETLMFRVGVKLVASGHIQPSGDETGITGIERPFTHTEGKD